MNSQVTALCIHGMNNGTSWWKPVSRYLHKCNIATVVPELPSLDEHGPEAWVEAVLEEIPPGPSIIIGHSLGAAVAIEVTCRHHFEMVVLLSLPPFLNNFTPPPPPRNSVSMEGVARVARFMKRACLESSHTIDTYAVHIVGDSDEYVPLEKAAQLPFKLVVVKGVSHELTMSKKAIREIGRTILTSPCGITHCDPGLRSVLLSDKGTLTLPALYETAPQPVRLDIEITTRCQLCCPACARTLYSSDIVPQDMPATLFEKVIGDMTYIRELFFVGLGEPLLHPDITHFVQYAAHRKITTKLVTNGLDATPDLLEKLHRSGLSEVTFSIDTTDPDLFRRLRGGASLAVVLDTIRNAPVKLTRSIFVTLSQENYHTLPGVIDLAVELGLPAVALSDVNFPENQSGSVHRLAEKAVLSQAIRYAHQKQIVLISPHFHNISDIPAYYRHFMITDPAAFSERAAKHTHCLSPWRIGVVGVDGTLTPCNCAPKEKCGTVADNPFSLLWNGEAMHRWRQSVMDASNPLCKGCPRY